MLTTRQASYLCQLMKQAVPCFCFQGSEEIGLRHSPRIQWLSKRKVVQLGFSKTRRPGFKSLVLRAMGLEPATSGVTVFLDCTGQRCKTSIALQCSLISARCDFNSKLMVSSLGKCPGYPWYTPSLAYYSFVAPGGAGLVVQGVGLLLLLPCILLS